MPIASNASAATPAPDPAEPALALHDLAFAWQAGQPLLNLRTFTIARGGQVFLSGPSGCGKSTLLGLIGGVMAPDRGQINILGRDITRLSGGARDRLRADHLGIVFQMFNLVPYLGLRENILLACRFSARRCERLAARGTVPSAEADRLLTRLDLHDARLRSRPVADLSIGQQQRVALARALIGAPELLIADEPTSALDAENRDRFIDLLLGEAAAQGSAVLLISHDDSLAHRFSRQVSFADLNAPAAPGSNH